MEQSEPGDLAPDTVSADEKRDVVAQATGVLVAQFEIDPEAAFDTLAGVASDNQRHVFDVACDIVENGGLQSPYKPPEQRGRPQE